jgi:hypothetical protein
MVGKIVWSELGARKILALSEATDTATDNLDNLIGVGL